MSKRPPSLEAKRILRLIESILGTTRIQGTIIGILVITSIGWFGDSVMSLFDEKINWLKASSGLLFMPALITVMVLYIRNISTDINIDVKPDIKPQESRVLILILSPPLNNLQTCILVTTGSQPQLLPALFYTFE